MEKLTELAGDLEQLTMKFIAATDSLQSDHNRLKGQYLALLEENNQLKTEAIKKMKDCFEMGSNVHKQDFIYMVRKLAEQQEVEPQHIWHLLAQKNVAWLRGQLFDVKKPKKSDGLGGLDPLTCELMVGDECEVVSIYSEDIEDNVKAFKYEKGYKIIVLKAYGKEAGCDDQNGHYWSCKQLKLIKRNEK